MSDENNLNNDLNEMIGDAKQGAKKAADKAGDFAKEAKEAASEFTSNAKQVLGDGKNVAIIGHITLIGWIVALIMNSGNKKSEYASFYLRQMLGIMILFFVVGIIPVVQAIGWILPLVLWVMSLIGALSGNKKEVFLLGKQFQNWFKSI